MLESQLLMFIPVYVQSSPLQKWQQLPAWGLQMLLRQLQRRQAILLVSFAIFPLQYSLPFCYLLQTAPVPKCS